MTLAATVVKPHTRIVRADVLEDGAVVATSTTDVKLTSGNVAAVRLADVRRQATATFAGAAAVPFSADDLLDPLARRELRLWRGVVLADGTHDLHSLGIVTIERAEVDRDSDGGLSVKIAGRDRAVRVIGNPWRTPYTIASGTNVAVAIQAIIEDRVGVGTFTFAFTPTTEVTTGAVTYDPSTNPWAAAQRLAKGLGMELFFDADGICVLRPIPDPVNDPVAWSFTGTGRLLVGGTSRTIDGTKPVNGVVVQAQAPWLLFPVSGEAWDDNPESPTRRERIGEYAETVRDATVFTSAQATAAAEALLLDKLGVEEQVTWKGVPIPSLQVGDVIELDSLVLQAPTRAVVETLTMPLGVAESMTGSTRQRRAA